jgi:hypothetical protein
VLSDALEEVNLTFWSKATVWLQMLLLSVLFRCNPIQHCTEATIMRASGLPRYCYDAIWKPRTYATLTHNALAHCVMWSGHICRCSQTHFVFTAFQLRSGNWQGRAWLVPWDRRRPSTVEGLGSWWAAARSRG